MYDNDSYRKFNLLAVAREDHSQNDCFVLVVMSHGEEGKVYAKVCLALTGLHSSVWFVMASVWRTWRIPWSVCGIPFWATAARRLWTSRSSSSYRPVAATISRGPWSSQSSQSWLENWPHQRPQWHSPLPMPFPAPLTCSSSTQPSRVSELNRWIIEISSNLFHFPEFYSFRNVEYGSWFIQTLCKVLDLAACNEASQPEGVDLLRLLTTVNRKVAYEYQSDMKNVEYNQMKEMPNFMSTLTKNFNLRVKPKNWNSQQSLFD